MQRWGREEKARIRTILQMTGFEHILPSLIFPSSVTAAVDGASSLQSPNEQASPPATRRGAGPHLRSSLLTVSSQASSIASTASNQPTILASLRTSSPSCPACRGPVTIHFIRESATTQLRAGKMSPSALEQRYTRARKLLRIFARGWWREYLVTVTGRSLLIRLAAQYTFLLVLVSMIKASGRGRVKK